MLRDELNIKYLSESMILRYLRNESDEKERFIVEKLKSNDINWENFVIVKEMYEKGVFNKPNESSIQYEKYFKKFMELSKKNVSDPDFIAEKEQLKRINEPSAGQIWLTKAVPQLGNYEFEPVAFPKYVYILTNPQPYQLLDNYDSVQTLKEYYTLLVLPVSVDTEFATHEDYIVEAGNNILNIKFMIETWLETSMLVCNLKKCVGELNNNQIDELLNIYFSANSMEYNKDIYNRAKKGGFHDKDYGDIYDFHRMEEENIEYLYGPVNKLGEFFDGIDEREEETRNKASILLQMKEPVLAMAAGDENIIPVSAQNTYAQLVLFSDANMEFRLVVKEEGQLFIRLKLLARQDKNSIIIKTFSYGESYETLQNPKGLIIIKNKLSNEELQRFENISLMKAIQYLHIKKLLRNCLVEISFYINDKFYFLKNIDLRNVEHSGENRDGNSK